MTDRKRQLQLLRADVESALEFYKTAASKLEITRQALNKFQRENQDIMKEEYAEQVRIRNEERKKKKDKEEIVKDVVIEHVKPDMWVKVKTSRGSEYRYVTSVDVGKYYCSVKAARVMTESLMFKTPDKKIRFRDIIVTASMIERQDSYVPNSIISILVKDENDPLILKEVSIRKDLIK